MVASRAQGTGDDATTIAFGLDPDQDRVLTEAITMPAGTKTLTNHYDDASDEAAWTSTLKIDGTTVTKRYVDGIDGRLSATVADDGTVKLDLTNLHGDTVATIDPDATSIGDYHETTEYGLPRDAASAADDYGWLGAKKRSSNDLGGLTLMGVRLYNPGTGRFLSVDPVPGGNANAYTYPTDPIDERDNSGACPWCAVVGAVGADDFWNPVGWAAAGTLGVYGAYRAGKAAYNHYSHSRTRSSGISESPTDGFVMMAKSKRAGSYDGEQGGAEHTNGARKSTTGKHQAGRTRKVKDFGGEKGDTRRKRYK